MAVKHRPNRVARVSILLALAIFSIALVTSLRPLTAAPVGLQYDHIVIIAMENQNYGSVIGSSSAPFINSLAAQGTTISNYHSYGANAFSGDNINGCSAACYVALISGSDNGVSDGYSCCLSGTTLVDQLQVAGLTWQAYCESGCPRGNDHFPFTGFASDANSPNVFTGSSVSTSQFIAAANSPNPPNFLWFTPTDNHNMHDNSVSSGDSYLKKFLVGNGTVLSPASGSLLASSLFRNPQYRTLLYLWWDEYDPSPNVEYGSMIKKGYTSTASYDEFSSLRMIENNWNLGTLMSSANALPIPDIFGTIGPLPLSASFAVLPLTPIVNATVSLTAIASGGTLPYSYSWSFGDGATGTGLTTTHTYTAIGNYSVTLTAHDSAGGSAGSTQTVRVVPFLSLIASFTASPTIPDAGQTVTFTAIVQGGNAPYSYGWTIAGTSKTGNPVSQSFTNGTFVISLVVTDNAGMTATSSESLVVLPSSTGVGSVPVLIGWGGVRMDESVANTGGVPSAVFPGEYASNMELSLILLRAKGYNTVRVDFDPYCTDTVDYNYMSVYSQANAQRAVHIAQHYGFWIIIDYHGYSDIFRNTSCWLNYWKPIVQNIGPLYSQIVWEPENEPEYYDCKWSPVNCSNVTLPCSSDSSCVTYLGSAYQQWIDQARSLGDTHWIVVQNLCSYSCGLCPGGDGACSSAVDGYPLVSDPLGTLSQSGRIFISLHSYMSYNSYNGSAGWNNATADSVAQAYYQTVVAGITKTGWPALNTEGGTDPLCYPCSNTPPDTVLSGSAGYTNVTFHFIQTLVRLYDTNSPQRINWVWWPAGSWTDTTSSVFGAMNCASNPEGWGCLLRFASLFQLGPDFIISASSQNGLNTGQSASSTITITGQNGFAGTVTLTDAVPSGLNCGAITPSSLTGSGTATVSCNSLIPSTYTLTITGANGSIVHSTTAAFNFRQEDFTITATSPGGVYTTKSATATISVSGENGFNGTVTLAETIPSGLDCGSLVASDLTGSGSTTVSCNSPTAGTFTLGVTGTSGSLTHSASAVFRFKDFALTASPPPPVDVGSSANSTVAVIGLNGFSGTVVFTDIVPNGLTCGPVTPNNTIAYGNATLSCNATTRNVYSVTIQATSGSLTHSTTVSFAFGNPPDFVVSSTQPPGVEVGSSITSTITVRTVHGFNGTVVLSGATPSNLSCDPISPGKITGNGTATISCGPTAASTYPVTVTGTSGGLVHTSTFIITAIDFSLSASPTSISLDTGTTGSSTITVAALNGFGGNVTVIASSPSDLLTVLSSDSVTGTGSLTLLVSSVAMGSYTVSITGTSGSLSRTANVTVHVGRHVPPVLEVPAAETVSQLATLSFIVNATDQSIPTSTLTLSATNLPQGASFATTQGPVPVSGIFNWTPGTTIAPGTYTVTFTVTNGVLSTEANLVITVMATNVLPAIIAPGPRNATVGATLGFTVSASDPSGSGGSLLLSATGLVSNMAFDPSTGYFSFTPGVSQAGQTFTVDFTVTNSNNPSWTSTQRVPIHVENASNTPGGTPGSKPGTPPSSQPSPAVTGGDCLTCNLAKGVLAVAWFLLIGVVIGVVTSIALLTIKTRAKFRGTLRLRSRMVMKTRRRTMMELIPSRIKQSLNKNNKHD